MMSLLLPYATPGWSLIAGWCLIGATPRGQPRTPAIMLPHEGEGLRMRRKTALWTFCRPFMGHWAPHEGPAQRGARCDHARARNRLPLLKLRREMQ
jgi:hypothetical protein